MPKTSKGLDTRGLELRVSIRNRRKILFDGTAFSVSSFNTVGEFAVLPQHANFISLIKDKVVLDKGTPNEVEFDIESGLISVDESGVNIYAGIGSESAVAV
jgi:F0F1-type ATP synthase epsilon subunit